MPRGRLIFPFYVDLARLDTSATDADPDGAGALESGYDDIFREPVIVPPASGGSERGTPVREEIATQVPAQIEDDAFEEMQLIASGNSPEGKVVLVFHFKDLETLGLVDADGEAMIRINDRLVAIRRKNGDLVQTIRTPPGLYCTEAKPRSFGLSRTVSHRNLLVCTFMPRQLSEGS